MDNIYASSETPGALKNCDFSSSWKKPHEAPGDLVLEMAGLGWGTAPAVLKSPEYHEYRNMG